MTRSTTRHQLLSSRALAIAAAIGAALLLAVAPAAAQDAPADATPRGVDDVCPPPGMAPPPAPLFTDISDSVHVGTINCVAQYGIAAGFGDNTYRPNEVVRRNQMATFIVNMIEVGTMTTLPDPGTQFPDIAGDHHAGNINKLAGIGIVSGRADGTYGPFDPVSRGAMATFIANAIDYIHNGAVDGSAPPPTTTNFFPDIVGTAHQGNINRLAAQGIVAGRAGGNYEPNEPVLRGAMATFILHGASFLHELGAWAPTAGVYPPAAPAADDIEPEASVEQETLVAGDSAIWYRTNAALLVFAALAFALLGAVTQRTVRVGRRDA